MAVLSKGATVPLLGHVTIGGVVLGVAIGVIFASQVRRIPGVDRLPTV
jgi:hypothetical protein